VAAETAKRCSPGGGSLADGQKLYADIKGRMTSSAATGPPEDPARAFVVVGDSVEEAAENAPADSMCITTSATPRLSGPARNRCLGLTPMGIAADPETMPQRAAPAAGRWSPPRQAHRRQLAQRVGGICGLALSAGPRVADQMRSGWTGFAATASTYFPFLPQVSTTSRQGGAGTAEARGFSRYQYEGGRCGRPPISACTPPKNRFFEA